LDCGHGVLVSDHYDLSHLIEVRVPAVEMSLVDGTTEDLVPFAEDLATFARSGPLVIHTFPGIDWWADAPQVSDEDAAQAHDFCVYSAELSHLGYRILGISTQSVGELARWARRERISYFLASDAELRLADALDLPTWRERRTVYQRLVLIVRDGRIIRDFYPVTQPDHAAAQVLSWLYQAGRGRNA
jgi:peroxiredoxin